MISETVDCSISATFVVKNMRGLHTRPCTEIVKCAAQFDSDIYIRYRDEEVNAKSLLGLLMLAAEKHARIRIIAMGSDAKEAIEALLNLAKSSFNMNY